MPSFSFGGVKKPYIESVFGGRKRQVYNLKRNFLYVPGRPGAYSESTDIDVKVIEEEVILIAQDREDLQKIKEDLAAWLITDEPKELIFDDEPDRVYYALVDGTFDPDDFVNLGSGTITFVVPDGCKYGPELIATFPSDVVSLTNRGTADADPIFELEVKEPVTFAMIQNDKNEYMMIGKPYDLTQQKPYIPEKRVFWHEMDTTVGWTTPATVENGEIAGNITSNGYKFIASSFGTGQNWHGPALKTSIPEAPLQNFKIDVIAEFFNVNQKGNIMGRLEIDLLNDADEVVAKLALTDVYPWSNIVIGQARAGKADSLNHYLINEYGDYTWVWNDFYGVLRILRKGNQWEAYIAKVMSDSGRHHSQRFVRWTDHDGIVTDEITQVRIYMAQFADKPAARMAVHDIKIWRLEEKQDEVPYIADEGDIITFDHKEKLILLNGEPRKDLKDFGASYFTLKPGENQLIVMPENSFDVKCRYRERFK